MTQLICDRCGKVAPHLFVLKWKRMSQNNYKWRVYSDLCPTCSTLLREFINEYKPK